MTTFAEDFRREMEARGLTVADVSRRSGINKGTLHHYLRGDYIPKHDNVALIAKAIGVSPADLCGYSEKDESAADALRAELISKILLMDDATVTILNQLADSILSQRQP